MHGFHLFTFIPIATKNELGCNIVYRMFMKILSDDWSDLMLDV